MANIRECKLIMATGQKGVGKSHETLKEIIWYLVGNKQKGIYPRKVLIFDINDEYGEYRFDLFSKDPEIIEMLNNPDIKRLLNGEHCIKIKPIAPEHIIIYSAHPSIEVRRIRPYYTKDIIDKKKNVILHKKGDAWYPEDSVNILTQALLDFRGGLFLIEDMSSVFGDTINKTVAGLITRNRHRDLDIIMHLQSISPILPRMWQNINLVRYHSQIDPVEKSKKKLLDFYQIYKIAELLVNNSTNNKTYVWIDNFKRKIIGDYDKEQFASAVKEYLLNNYNELKDLHNKRNEDGNKRYNYSEALKLRTDYLVNKYSVYDGQ